MKVFQTEKKWWRNIDKGPRLFICGSAIVTHFDSFVKRSGHKAILKKKVDLFSMESYSTLKMQFLRK